MKIEITQPRYCILGNGFALMYDLNQVYANNDQVHKAIEDALMKINIIPDKIEIN